QAEAALTEKLRRERSLKKVFQAIHNSLDLSTIFATATAETVQLLPGFNCSVVQYFPDKGLWKTITRFEHGSKQPVFPDLEILDLDNPFAEQLKQLQIVQVRDTQDIVDAINQVIARLVPGAWLLIPLVVEGEVWGSFTLSTSDRPFNWSQDTTDLAQAVANQLEVAIQQAQLYQQVEQEKQKLLQSQTALAQAQQIAQLGNWELDVATGAMNWSDNLFRIFGLDPATPEPNLAYSMANCVHVEDRPRLKQALTRAITAGAAYEIDLRIHKTDGHIGYMEVRAEAIRDRQGKIVKVFGTSLDISDRKQAEAALAESELRYRKIVEAQTDFIVRSLPDTTITFANLPLYRAKEKTLDEIVGKKWHECLSFKEAHVRRQVAALRPDQPRFAIEDQHQRSNGQMLWIHWLNEGIFKSGRLVEIQSVGRDITALKQVEQALRDSEERLRLVTENMSDLVCLHYLDGRYFYVTPSSFSMLGYQAEELIGHNIDEFSYPEDYPLIQQAACRAISDGVPITITYRICKKTGDYIWVETLVKPVTDDQGQVIHLQTTSRDVSDRIKIQQQLKHDALHDHLTGLPNRSLLVERLTLALRRTKRQPNYRFAVLFLDLDNFKVVNDSLGHLVGDKLLIKIADLLRTMIRETDLAARLGGDEFVILLDQLDEIEEVKQIAERIVGALQTSFQVSPQEARPGETQEIFISTSIGIVVGTSGYQQAEELLRDSDLAMYWAKRKGRGDYAVFEPAMRLKAVQRLQVESDLRKAIENSEFVLYYQPIVYLRSQDIQGFEALIRWQHPKRGLLSPTDFIEIAEETGQIEAIGEWTLHSACQQLASWQAQFPNRPLKISVNLSVQQLQPSLLPMLEDILTSYPIQPSSLILEITESVLVQTIDATVALLKQIQAKGIEISIDDFGTGYSSLSYLHQLPVDALKIDRAFVSQIEPNARSQVIAELIIALSHLLGLSAIAEGVETPQQLKWLKRLGC
ncbi:MAG: EAL domain-containing protein, partial [Phormidesmis sp.]